jgi:hypothetical protein
MDMVLLARTVVVNVHLLGMETSGLVTGYREPSSVETGMPEYTGSAVAGAPR